MYWKQDERNGRKCWVSEPVSILTGREKITVAYGETKCVFRSERNVGNVEQERSAIDSEFQIVDAANHLQTRPFKQD